MTLPLVFGLLVVLFAVIGSLRGWAKELLVACSLVLAMFINMLLDKYAAGLLGAVLGALNGALLFGSIWFFLHKAGYPFPGLEQALASASNPDVTAMMQYMPPVLLGELWVFVAVAVAFIFVIVVFV
jgi:uncharacterized membrane protein required for colicin V production